jgi:hypothetical protein
MTKQTQMYVGVGVVAIAGYFLYKSMMKPKANFMNLTAPPPDCGPDGQVSTTEGCGCPPKNGVKPKYTLTDGTTIYPNGHICCKKLTGPCSSSGDKSFVGNNSKVFKGDNFVGDNSRVFKGDM